MTVHEICKYFDGILMPGNFSSSDSAYNGLQIGNQDQEVIKIAFAVDACLASFERARDMGAQLIVVHHGMYWGRYEPITGNHYERIRFLVENKLAVYASHLPLDAHLDLGNNAGLAKRLALLDIEAFAKVRGSFIGIKGRLPDAMRIEEISEKLFKDERGILGILPFGKSKIETIGIVSGGAPHCIDDAIRENLDLFITGEPGHVIYHKAQEVGINVLFGGHYNTETWGVSQLMKRMKDDLKIEAFFIDLPTGL